MTKWEPWAKEFKVPFYPHVSTGWDTNPRYKNFQGTTITNRSPKAFAGFLRQAKSHVDKHKLQPRLITINSWNEWCEGSYLEPCERYGKGNLIITVRRNGERIETGCVGTPGKFEATHGYFEVRCRVLNTKGAWCAFWVHSPSIGDPVGDASRAGVELDVIEYFGPNWEHEDHVRHTAHWDGYGKNHKVEGVGKPYPEITKRFCTFAMKWDSEGYIFYVDGEEGARLKEAPMSNRPQYLILSCEVEKWCGKIEEAVLPDTFTIDHVRVWQTPVQIEADAKRPTILTATAAKALLDRRGYFGCSSPSTELSGDRQQFPRHSSNE